MKMRYKLVAKKNIRMESTWTWLWITLLVLCSVASLVFLYDYVITRETVNEVAKLQGQLADQQSRLQILDQERASLSKQLATAESTAKVDRIAVAQIKKEMSQYQTERSELEEELILLRGLVSEGKKLLLIRDIRLTDSKKPNAFRYKLTVARSVKGDDSIKGKVLLSVNGVLNNKKKTLTLDAITSRKAKYLKMRFQYFQILEGELRLPEGFKPKSFLVEVRPEGKGVKPVVRRFSWIITQK